MTVVVQRVWVRRFAARRIGGMAVGVRFVLAKAWTDGGNDAAIRMVASGPRIRLFVRLLHDFVRCHGCSCRRLTCELTRARRAQPGVRRVERRVRPR
jgi:hypothetical protein